MADEYRSPLAGGGKFASGHKLDFTSYYTTSTTAHLMHWNGLRWWSYCGHVSASYPTGWASGVEPDKAWCRTCVGITSRIIRELQAYVTQTTEEGKP